MKNLSFKIFFIVLFLFGTISSARSLKKETDFRAFYIAGKRIWAKTTGISDTDKEGISVKKEILPQDSLFQNDPAAFKYAPVVAYIFVPFSFFPLKWAQLLWFGVSFSLLVLSFYLIFRHFKEDYFKDPKLTFWFFFIILLLQVRFFSYDIANLQINFLLLLGYVGFLVSWKKNETLAGFLLALMVGIKIFPIFLLVFLLVEKKYRLIAKTLIWGAFLIFIPILSYRDVPALITEYQNYFSFMTNGQHAFPAPATYLHPNLDSLIVRLFMDKAYYGTLKTNLFFWDGLSTFWLINSLKFFILGAIIWIHLGFRKVNNEIFSWAIFGLYSNYIIIINPLAWKHAMVSMTIPWVAIGLFWIKNQGFRMKEKFLFGASFALLILSSQALLGETQKTVLGRIGHDFWGIILMSLLLIYMAKRSSKLDSIL
jgi:Glycosyltransferase family 87